MLRTHPKFSDEAISTSALDTATMFGVDASVADIEDEISSMPSTPHEGVGTQEAVRDGVHTPITLRDAVHTSNSVRDEVGGESKSSAAEVPNVQATTMNVGVQIAGQQTIGKKSLLRIREMEIFREGAVEKGKMIVQCLERRNNLAEEKTALLAYKLEECETPEDLEDRAEYLRLIHKDRLRTLCKPVTAGSVNGAPRHRFAERSTGSS